MYRLTGSLALSIAYGIQADSINNNFFRMFRELSAQAGEAMVLGAFLVDILPPRRFDRLNTADWRALTIDDLNQLGICPRGAQESGSMRMRTKSRKTSI